MFYSIIRSFLFSLPAEEAHHRAMSWLRSIDGTRLGRALLRSIYRQRRAEDRLCLFGLEFPNRIGLAAGFDKNAEYMHALASLGFGFIEVGTVTPLPQDGNPQPRLFRLKSDKALINRMGFNNGGLEDMVERLKGRPRDVIIGANIGKNKVTPNAEAKQDYLKCLKALHPYVDYFVVNVSSPNTPGLRELQEREPLTEILQLLKNYDAQQSVSRPMLLKIAPDLSDGQLDDIVEIVAETGLQGIIATNTTIERSGLQADKNELEDIGAGGLSGAPLRARATEVIQRLKDKANGRFEIIGVGGIHNADSAQEKFDAGASLVQVYSGFVYEGPGMVSRILSGLRTN